MSAYIGERYQLCKVILHLADGVLYEAIDLSLKRDVFIYLVENKGLDKAEQCKKAFGQISHFSNNRFFHMLNAGTSGSDFFVVFTSYNGMPLAKYIQHHALSANKTLSLLYEVGKAIQDALESNITNFSVSVDNLWITEDHQVLVMNYWSEAPTERCGTLGLCYLLYQLSTLHLNVPQYYEMYESRLAGALKELSPGQKEALLSLVQSVYLGEISQFSFMLTLREIMDSPNIPVKTIGGIYTPPVPKVDPELLITAEEEAEEEEAAPYEADNAENVGRKKMILILACAAVFICVLGGAVMLANSLSKANDAAISTDAPESNDQVATENPATEPGTDSDASQQDSGSSTNVTEPPVTDNNNNSSNDNSSQERETEKKSDDADRKSTERDRDRDHNRDSNSNNTSVTPPTTPEKKPDDHTTDSGTTNNGAHDGQTGTTPDTTTPPDGQQPDGQQPDPNTNTTTEPPKSGEIAVPNLVGLSKEEAEKQILASGLKYEYVLENSDEQEAGKVFKQEVPAGGAAKKGDKIKFYVSRAKK
ncbi:MULTISPECIES: PASTA domain-containing protein [Paenibacillus]|uniref:PASTA domain-containing protein n=1 Tax=Paenibacillus alvei TaxID=44250 RepID=A0ABT4EH01_PAEAL|nr:MULTISPECIES: PASTA domain-containing protein [Paenibacillus]MCY9531723.1 PASTA domain-containing protein [Paenibacillus alvei]